LSELSRIDSNQVVHFVDHAAHRGRVVEIDLLVYLLQNKNQVLSREQILTHVWGYDFAGDTNVVDVYIRYLRKKIDYPFELQLIHTYRGVGYSLKEPV
jgi:DNA-binding response OmpR family regulator